MERLSDENLVSVFSCLESWRLIDLQRVCVRWKRLVDDCFWKRKTTVEEDDIGMCLPLEQRVDCFIDLLRLLAKVEYYVFPFTRWFSKRAASNTSAVHASSARLGRFMTKMLSEGRVPVHLAALEFLWRRRLRKARSPFRELSLSPHQLTLVLRHCSIDQCHSVIIPTWPAMHPNHVAYLMLNRVLSEMSEVRELIVEEFPTHLMRVRDQPDVLQSALASLSAVHIRQVTCHDSNNQHFVTVRLRDELFTVDELTALLNCIESHMFDRSEMPLMDALVDEWQASGRLGDSHRGSVVRSVSIRSLDPPRFALLARLLAAPSPAVDASHPKAWLHSLLSHDRLDCLTHLVLDVDLAELAGRELDESVNYFDDLCLIWDGLFRRSRLSRLQTLEIHLQTPCLNQQSYVTPPVDASGELELPCLLELTIHGPVFSGYLSSLLQRASHLRHLELDINSEAGSEEQFELARSVLSAIGKKTTLVSLDLTVNQADDADDSWKDPWVTFVPPSHVPLKRPTTDDPRPPPPHAVELQEELLNALTDLGQLEWLGFTLIPRVSYEPVIPRFGGKSNQLARIRAILPQLVVIQLHVGESVFFNATDG